MKLRSHNTFRIISAILLVAFLAQDVAWAYPTQTSNSNLAVPGLQNASVLSRLKKVLANKLLRKNGRSFKAPATDTTNQKDPITQNHPSANIVLPPDISAALKDIDEKTAKHIIDIIRRIDSHEKIGIMRQNHWLEHITGLLGDPRTQYKIIAAKVADLIFENSYHLDKMDEGSLRKAEEALLAALNDTNLQVRLAVISAMHKLFESSYDVRVYTLKQMAGRFDELIRKYHKVDATLEDAALRAMMALSSERGIELSSAYAARAFDENLKAQARTLGKNIRTFLKEERRSDFRMRGLSRVLDRCVVDSGMGLTAYIRSVYFMEFIENLFSDEKTDIAKIKEYVLKLPRGSSNIDGRIIVYDPILKLADKELSEMYFTSGQDVRSLLSWRKDSEPVQAFDFYGEVFMTQSRARFLEMVDKGLVYYDANQKRFVTNPATFIDVASGETSMPDSNRITDGDALSMYITELETMDCYIMSDAKSHEKNFLRPLFELLFNRLEKDFEGSEDFIAYCRELIRRWPEGSYEIRKAMNDEEAILLEKFGKIKNSYATRNASIQLYGILLFYLTLKPQPYLGHLYDEYMKNSPPHNLSLYRTGISYHTRGDNVIYFFPKNLLFKGANADALGKQRRGEALFKDARKSENAAKILEAVKIWRRECPNLENRIKRFENNSTVSELIMKTSLIFSDPVHNVIRVVHAGRGRRLLFLPKNYLDSLRVDSEYDMKELAVWLNFAQRYLDIHDHMSGRKVAAHQVQKVLSELVRRSFEKEDTHLVEPEILKYRMSQLMKQDELIKYKDVLISLALEEAEVQVMEKISRSTKDELMILENAYGRIAHGYEVLGMKSRSERAYNGMADIITKIQSTDPWALPYELQVDLILTALRFGRWEDFIIELKILLTGKGYPRDIRWIELSYLMKEIITPASIGPRSLESTIQRALAAQIAAADPRSSEVIKETAEKANRMLSEYFKNPFSGLGLDDIVGCPSREALERLKRGEDDPRSLVDIENRLIKKVAGFESLSDVGRMDPYAVSMTTRTANTLEGMGHILKEFRKPIGDAGISDAEVKIMDKSTVVVDTVDKDGHEQGFLLKILSRDDPAEKAVEDFLRNDLSMYEGLAKNNGCENIILVLGKKHPSYPTNIIVPSEQREGILMLSYGLKINTPDSRTGGLKMLTLGGRESIDTSAVMPQETTLVIPYLKGPLYEFKNQYGNTEASFLLEGSVGAWAPLYDKSSDRIIIAHVKREPEGDKVLPDHFVLSLKGVSDKSQQLLYFPGDDEAPVPVRIPAMEEESTKEIDASWIIGWLKAANSYAWLVCLYGQQVDKRDLSVWATEPVLSDPEKLKAIAQPLMLPGVRSREPLIFLRHKPWARLIDLMVFDPRGKGVFGIELGRHNVKEHAKKAINLIRTYQSVDPDSLGGGSVMPKWATFYADEITSGNTDIDEYMIVGQKSAIRRAVKRSGLVIGNEEEAGAVFLARMTQAVVNLMVRSYLSRGGDVNNLPGRINYIVHKGFEISEYGNKVTIPVLFEFYKLSNGKYLIKKYGVKRLKVSNGTLKNRYKNASEILKRLEAEPAIQKSSPPETPGQSLGAAHADDPVFTPPGKPYAIIRPAPEHAEIDAYHSLNYFVGPEVSDFISRLEEESRAHPDDRFLKGAVMIVAESRSILFKAVEAFREENYEEASKLFARAIGDDKNYGLSYLRDQANYQAGSINNEYLQDNCIGMIHYAQKLILEANRRRAHAKTASMLDAPVQPYSIAEHLKSIHDLTKAGITAHPIHQGAEVLLSETLFNEIDRENLNRLLGKDSPVRIMPAREIRNASMNHNSTKQNLACIIRKEDYDDPELWNRNNKANNKATMLILSEDLQDSRYLYLEGVVGLARAIMNEDADSIEIFIKLLFNKTQGLNDAELLKLLIADPRKFADYIRFKAQPFNKEELYERYKTDVENYLVAA
ncbi:MAG: hypothetical protein NT036_04645 [Candidatus Omnitrophica bacterium]|nr:hypothetical protein [Candidatus Omnitrophota bacterium]